ncbi:ESX secretion-associated protein EspG [Nocardia sp. NPDC057668]|uniref:ESX secretion-associated protein EspG n=1 Tax=Nocardia sp. NPDC057668 TaxID=3346202 RepID=UPI00366F61E4
MSERRFGDLEFTVLWELMTGEDLPHPFLFTSSTPLLIDYMREKQEVARRLRADWDAALGYLETAVTQPDLRIVVNGFDGHDPGRADGCIRMMAIRHRDRGYLLTQLPGKTYAHSGGFVVRECDALRLADEVVRALPECDAGKQADIPLVDPQGEAGTGRVVVDDIFEDSAGHRSKMFLTTVPTVVGTIDVIQGRSEFGPRGTARFRLQWRDLDDDGRYAIGSEPPVTAVGVDSKRLVTMINTRIAEVVRRIRDERGTLQR